jgi:dTDP-4-dehydrorhamnose reductase
MSKSLLVTGGSGFVGGHVLAAGAAAGWRVINADRQSGAAVEGVEFRQTDIANEAAVNSVVAAARPYAIIHCAAIGDVDQSERDPDLAWRVNVNGTANIARAAAGVQAHLVFISTSTIFDGRNGRYREDDPPNPINVYGRTKVAAEHAVRVLRPPALIVRVSMAYGYPRTGGASFLTRVEEKLRAGEPTDQPADEFRTPIDVLTCADALIELAGGTAGGILHLGPRERISRYDFAVKVAQRLGADSSLVRDNRAEALPGRAPRPKDVSFNTDRAHAVLRTPPLDPEAGLARVMQLGPDGGMSS